MTYGCTELNRVVVIISVSACLRCDVGRKFTWRHIDVTDRQTDISSPDAIGTHKQARELHIFQFAAHNTSTPPIGIMLFYCCILVSGSSSDCSVLWPRLYSDRFRVVTAETVNVAVFWDVTPCDFCCCFWSIPFLLLYAAVVHVCVCGERLATRAICQAVTVTSCSAISLHIQQSLCLGLRPFVMTHFNPYSANVKNMVSS